MLIDDIVKEEILLTKLVPDFNVVAFIDDRKRVVDMWRRNGFTVFQVAEGNF